VLDLFVRTQAAVFGNASSIHWAGREAKKHLEKARNSIAARTGRRPSEVIFTSGGSEADNLALTAARNGRIIVSRIEHPAVLRPAANAELIDVSPDGVIDLASLDRALETPAALVSVMAVNNETGVIQPIAEVIARAHARGALVHVDAVQAAGRIPLPLDADLISLSGHKLGAPKGVGALLGRTRVHLQPLIVGGAQERGMRAGTEPVAHAVALAAALDRALDHDDTARLRALQARLEAGLTAIEGVTIVGAKSPRVANTTLAAFTGIEAETLLHALDLEGIAASSGSACSSGSVEPSPVLLAMGMSRAQALSAVRFSTGWASTEADVDAVIAVLPRLVARARR